MNCDNNRTITVLGAGSWGSTLSVLLFKKGFQLKLWEFNPHQAQLLKQERHLRFFPCLKIPEEIEITHDLHAAVSGSGTIIISLPSQSLRDVVKQLSRMGTRAVLVNTSKGLEIKTTSRLSEVIASEMGEDILQRLVVLSGPSHAEEVSVGLPTAVVVASKNIALAEKVQNIFSTSTFRAYTHTDVPGVELGGALKNIIAIACGIAEGLGFGDNATAALITRGLVEIARLGVKLGADPHTLFGLAGIGDLVATCTSHHSRNRNLGEKLGRGTGLKRAMEEVSMVTEGVYTTEAAWRLSKQHQIAMPITEQVYSVLFEDRKPSDAFVSLMERPPRIEKEEFFYNRSQ